MGRGSLALLGFVAGCTDAPDMPPLPHSVSIVLETDDEQVVSLLAAVEPNDRGRLDVRVSEGVVLPGGGRVVLVTPAHGGWAVGGALTGRRVPLSLPTSAWRLARVRGGHLWFSGDEGLQRCEMATSTCLPTGELPPGPEVQAAGPELGFRVTLDDDGNVFVLLPHHDGAGAGERVASDVRRIVSVRWLVDAPEPRIQEYLDRTFRGRADFLAPDLDVVVDGRLSEWGEIEPAVVDAPWQAEVRDGWNGPDDASFSAALAVDGDALCVAGRLRDDRRLDGDAVVLSLEGELFTVPVARHSATTSVRAEWFGWRYEACLPGLAAEIDEDTPIVLSYRDADGQGLASVIATSPSIGRWAVGRVERLP